MFGKSQAAISKILPPESILKLKRAAQAGMDGRRKRLGGETTEIQGPVPKRKYDEALGQGPPSSTFLVQRDSKHEGSASTSLAVHKGMKQGAMETPVLLDRDQLQWGAKGSAGVPVVRGDAWAVAH